MDIRKITLPHTTPDGFVNQLKDFCQAHRIIPTERGAYQVTSVTLRDRGTNGFGTMPRGVAVIELAHLMNSGSVTTAQLFFDILPVGENLQVSLPPSGGALADWVNNLRDALIAPAQPGEPSAQPAAQGRDTAPALPPVTDPTDKRILELVTDDPDLSDRQIGAQISMTRENVNKRRNKLKSMGYKVR